MDVEIISVSKNEFNDKNNPGTKVSLYKLTFMLPDGICELWSKEPYSVGDVITLKIAVGSKYKPVVKIA